MEEILNKLNRLEALTLMGVKNVLTLDVYTESKGHGKSR